MKKGKVKQPPKDLRRGGLLVIKNYLHQILIVCFTLVVFLGAVPNGYNLDDELVTNGHKLTSQGIKAIPQIITSPYYSDAMGYAYDYRPLVHITFALENQLFGDNPTVSHLVNVLLYSVLCLYIYLTLLLVPGMSRLMSFCVSILFVAFPLHTEVVCSIKNRDEILSLLFAILALYYVLVRRSKIQPHHTLGVLLCFGLSLASKYSSISFAVIIPLTAFSFYNISWRQMLYVTLALAIPVYGFNQQYIGVEKVIFSLFLMAAPFAIYFTKNSLQHFIKQIVSGLLKRFVGRGKLVYSGVAKATQYVSGIITKVGKVGFSYVQPLFTLKPLVEFEHLEKGVSDIRQIKYKHIFFISIAVLVFGVSIYKHQLSLALVWCAFLGLVMLKGKDAYERFWAFGLLAISGIMLEASNDLFKGDDYTMTALMIAFFFLVQIKLVPTVQKIFLGGIFIVIVALKFFVAENYGTLLLVGFALASIANYRVSKILAVLVGIQAALVGAGAISDFFWHKNLVFSLNALVESALYAILAIWFWKQFEKSRLINSLKIVMLAKLLIGFILLFHSVATKLAPFKAISMSEKEAPRAEVVHAAFPLQNKLLALDTKSEENNPGLTFDRPINFVEFPVDRTSPQEIRIGTSAIILLHYLKRMLVPFPMVFYYGYKYIEPTSLFTTLALTSTILHLALLALLFWLYKRRPLISWGLFIYLAGVISVSGYFVPISGIVADRYALLPSLGFLILVVCFFFDLLRATEVNVVVGLPIKLKSGLLLLLLIYSGLTFSRNLQWKDSLTLMRHDIKQVNESAQAHNLLALKLVGKSFSAPEGSQEQVTLREEALEHFTYALDIYPMFFNAAYDIGRTQLLLNRKEDAMVAFQKAYKIDSTFSDLSLALGDLVLEAKDTVQAARFYQNVIRFLPKEYIGYDKLSYLYYITGQLDSSIAVNKKAISVISNVSAPYVNIGEVYVSKQMPDSACLYFRKAAVIEPQNEWIQKRIAECGSLP